MSWATDQVLEVYTEPRRQRVTGDSWRDLLKVPAADLKPFHTYAVVIHGNHGHYTPGVGIGITNAGALQLEYGGLYVADTLQRFDLSFGAMAAATDPNLCQGFQILAQFSVGASAFDLIFRGRCEDTAASPRASFDIEGLSIFIVDQTDWSGKTQYLATALGGTLPPYYSTPSHSALLNLTSDLTHGTLENPKRWLIWYSVVLQAEDLNVNAASWVTLTSAWDGSHLFERRSSNPNAGSWLGHSPRGRVGYWHRHHQGSGRVLEVSSTGVRPHVFAADLWGVPNPTKPLAAKILAIELNDIADEVHSSYSDAFIGLKGNWPPAEDPDWIQTGAQTGFLDQLRVCAITRALYSDPTEQLVNWYTALELDSLRLSPQTVSPMGVYSRAQHEVQALHRWGSVPTDAGKHCVRHVLWSSDPEEFRGFVRDHQTLVLSTSKGYGLSLPALPIPGPEVVIVPAKESLDVGSLPSLPIAPNTPPSWQELEHAFEFRTRTGRTVSWPLGIGPRRRGEIRWTGLTETDRDTLLEWLRSRSESSSAFAWQPPDLEAALPFVIGGEARWAHQGGGKYEVTTSAVELRYVGA